MEIEIYIVVVSKERGIIKIVRPLGGEVSLEEFLKNCSLSKRQGERRGFKEPS